MIRPVLSLITMSTLTVLPLACSSSNDGPAGAAGAAAHSSAGSHHSGDAAGSGTSDGGSSGAAPTGGSAGQTEDAVEAPMLKSVEPLEGGLHVMWMNVTKDCDKVVLLRSKDGGEYHVAYTLTGAADSQHDGQATAPGEYCYKARCIKGDQTSPDSDAKCGTP